MKTKIVTCVEPMKCALNGRSDYKMNGCARKRFDTLFNQQIQPAWRKICLTLEKKCQLGYADVEDIMQEASIKFFEYLLTNPTPNNVPGFMYTVALRIAQKHMAKSSTKNEIPMSAFSEEEIYAMEQNLKC